MTEETWILQQCSRPKCYGTLCGNFDNESSHLFDTYVVKDNDTLTSIAVKNDVSVCYGLLYLRFWPSYSVGSTTQFSKERTISNSNTDAADHQGLLMVDPLVQTITSSSHSFCKDQSLSSTGAV
ncbi:unnamed protein product [Taenia asiatica]|uniref:LysM domain-containing protein n=1 Tax=Taenia asiatica TaxID=60517 RepID=A0A0R3W7N8_TAEAS|nr:unnamed protein product [Taenia asiatica]